ncbi:MAG: hypothetical protein WEC37_05405, partial [Anaerolineales bacterium]
MKMKIALGFLAILLLTACAAPIAVATPTQIPELIGADIEPILILDGDLPPGYSAGQFSSKPLIFGLTEGISLAVSRTIGYADLAEAGSVTVFIYLSEEQADKNFETHKGAQERNPGSSNQVIQITGLGEEAYFGGDPNVLDFSLTSGNAIIFKRCQSIVVIVAVEMNRDQMR